MSGTRGGLGRLLAMGIGLGLVLALLIAGEARAGSYTVVQCGWGAGADADWADSTGGAKFRPDAFCAGGDGDHLKSFSRDGQGTVTGTRFARWRWTAPPGTGITAVWGTWWHALHDGIEQRIGFGNAGGGFDPFATAGGTDVTPRQFGHKVWPPQPVLEDRLLCARGESAWCSLDPGSWSGLRSLALAIQDDTQPAALMSGGLLGGGWARGGQDVIVGGQDGGAGVRHGQTWLDGNLVGATTYNCALVAVDGVPMGTRMRPCPPADSATHSILTERFSDGPHLIAHCAQDFAGNGACTDVYTVRFDNSPPAPPHSVAVAGGDGWHRVHQFDVAWGNPDQGPASPIDGVGWRLFGPDGFDTGAQFAAGRDRTVLEDLFLPFAGSYALQLWLRDEAGNEWPPAAAVQPLRFDDVPPAVAFALGGDRDDSEQIRAAVADAHSGPAAGTISYRRSDREPWTELPTRLQADERGAALIAAIPELAPGTYVFRAEAVDRAGNANSTTRRADGTEMVLHRPPPAAVAQQRALPPRQAPPRAKARLFARLRGGHGRGSSLTVPFAAPAILSGRLIRADGAGLSGRELRVVARPSRGALSATVSETVVTGERGGFQLRLGPGPSRRLAVSFAGDGGFEEASRAPLELRVRSGISLAAAPLTLRTGQAVRLSGRVHDRAAPLPRRGKLVAIQYLEAATGRWRPVLVTRSDHDGRFRARYRFRYVSGLATIRLRATALAEERWPYAPGSSAPITVSVRGR